MNFKPIKKVAKVSLFLVMSLTATITTTTEAQAQDLIARQAPIDRKMKAVDSVTINKTLKNRKQTVNYEQTDLYTTWETNKVHCYTNETTPDRYRIDLRGFAMPTPSRVVTSGFGYRASFGRMHKGIDVKVYIGDTIVSAFDGKVRVVNYEAKGYGNYVVIRHNNGLETIYGHLSKHLCKTGDVVKAGQPIGLGGNTGRSTGSHLHFETRLLGEAINPALLFDFVHQDVTGDFYEYRRQGAAAANQKVAANTNRSSSAKSTTPAKSAAPAKTPAPAKSPAPASEKPAAKANSNPAPKQKAESTAAKSQTDKKEETAKAAANKSAAQNKSNTAQAKAPAKNNEATAKANSAQSKSKTTAKATPAKENAASSKAKTAQETTAKTTSAKGKATATAAKATPAKEKATPAKEKATATAKSSSKQNNASASAKKETNSTSNGGAKKAPAAKATASASKSTSKADNKAKKG